LKQNEASLECLYAIIYFFLLLIYVLLRV